MLNQALLMEILDMPNQPITYFLSVSCLSHLDILEVEPSNTVTGGAAEEKQERVNVVLLGQCAIFPSFLFLQMVAAAVPQSCSVP